MQRALCYCKLQTSNHSSCRCPRLQETIIVEAHSQCDCKKSMQGKDQASVQYGQDPCCIHLHSFQAVATARRFFYSRDTCWLAKQSPYGSVRRLVGADEAQGLSEMLPDTYRTVAHNISSAAHRQQTPACECDMQVCITLLLSETLASIGTHSHSLEKVKM